MSAIVRVERMKIIESANIFINGQVRRENVRRWNSSVMANVFQLAIDVMVHRIAVRNDVDLNTLWHDLKYFR